MRKLPTVSTKNDEVAAATAVTSNAITSDSFFNKIYSN